MYPVCYILKVYFQQQKTDCQKCNVNFLENFNYLSVNFKKDLLGVEK